MPMIEIPVDGHDVEAYFAPPPGGTGPGVLFYLDAIGLRPWIEVMADRIASWGYAVLAPNLFWRTGNAADLAPREDLRLPGARERFFATLGSRVPDLTTERSLADTTAYLAALRTRPEVGDGPMGVTGYCNGARLATRAAGAHPETIAAVGGWHGGGLVTDAPDSPHLSIATARAAFAYGHADQDPSMPPEAVAALGQAISDAGLTGSNAVYVGARHGYAMADTGVYDETATERHFADLELLFAQTLR